MASLRYSIPNMFSWQRMDSRLRGNDVMGCGNDVMGFGNDLMEVWE